jgi:hypothetical protein
MQRGQVGVVGVVQETADEYELTLYSVRERKPIAIVRGSVAYVARALVASGLPPLITPLVENGDLPELALVGGKPSDRGT